MGKQTLSGQSGAYSIRVRSLIRFRLRLNFFAFSFSYPIPSLLLRPFTPIFIHSIPLSLPLRLFYSFYFVPRPPFPFTIFLSHHISSQCYFFLALLPPPFLSQLLPHFTPPSVLSPHAVSLLFLLNPTLHLPFFLPTPFPPLFTPFFPFPSHLSPLLILYIRFLSTSLSISLSRQTDRQTG